MPRPEKELDLEVLESILEEQGIETVEGLRKQYIEKSDAKTLDWNVVKRHIKQNSQFSIEKKGSSWICQLVN